jgi:hypothetical protein
MKQQEEPRSMSVALVELRAGTVSVALRPGGKGNLIRVPEGWENLTMEEAIGIVIEIEDGCLTMEEITAKPYKTVILPEGIWRSFEEGKNRQ